MKPLLFALFIATALLTLSGCATTRLTAEQCQNPDWYAIGVAEGKAGKYPHEITSHQKGCQAKLTPNRILWEQGRQEGLKSYCTKGNAYELGQHGYPLNNVCPNDKELSAIQESHALGYEQYYMRQRLSYGGGFGYPFGYPYYPYWW